MKKKIFWFAFFSVLAWGITQYWPVTINIRGPVPEENFSIRMPLRDKKRLEFFFREVCFLNVWAYTLMGSKPMSIEQYRTPWAAFLKQIKHPDFKDVLLECFWPPDFKKTCSFFRPEQLKMKLGWETLNKYISYFSKFTICFVYKPTVRRWNRSFNSDRQKKIHKNCKTAPE